MATWSEDKHLEDAIIDCHRSAWMNGLSVAPRSVFAIGDVHGRADLLAALHREVEAVVGESALKEPLVIHLGDYIDRGCRPLACLEMALDGLPSIETISLPGNHEQMMRHALEKEGVERDRILTVWLLSNGGDRVATELGMVDGLAAVRTPDLFVEKLKARLSQRLDRFRAMPNHVRLGGYLFVHAGINPAIPLSEQLARPWGELVKGDEDEDPLWVRGPFLLHGAAFEEGLIVVHGHTIRDNPEIEANRIGIDTGAYRSGVLTCLELRGDQMRFITAIAASATCS